MISSARNFRDLGGHAAMAGRRVRTGRVYRCGAITSLDDADASRLAALGIRRVIDFRSIGERESEPVRWPAASPIEVTDWDYELDREQYAGLLRDQATQHELDELMRQFYARMPYEFARCYRTLFEALLVEHVPLAFHCAAGKDRTGIAAALLLTALGVSRPTVFEDYLASNSHLDPARLGRPHGMPVAVFNLVARVDRSWLEAGFTAIEAADGSVEGFLERRLGIGPAGIERLQSLYLE